MTEDHQEAEPAVTERTVDTHRKILLAAYLTAFTGIALLSNSREISQQVGLVYIGGGFIVVQAGFLRYRQLRNRAIQSMDNISPYVRRMLRVEEP